MEDYAIIYNPTAAAGKSKKDFDYACKLLTDLGVTHKLYESEFATHAIELAKQAATDGYRVIACGGDGTCNEILNGVIQSKTGNLCGFIPMGSGNDIPAAIGIKSDVKPQINSCSVSPIHFRTEHCKVIFCSEPVHIIALNITQ